MTTIEHIARNSRKRSLGFTLIELLVVFTLLALLLSIAVPRYLNAADASRVKVRDQNMATLRDALDKFRADQGHFPAALEDLVTKKYLRMVPVDPVTGSNQWIAVQEQDGSQRIVDIEPPLADGELSPVPAETPKSDDE